MSTRRSGSLASLREGNRQRVIDALRERGLASRAELARMTGLSRSTVSTIVGDLIDTGLAVERDGQPDAEAHAGRPAGDGRARQLRRPRPGHRLRAPPPAGRRLGSLAHRSRRDLARARRRSLGRRTAWRPRPEDVGAVLEEADVDRSRVIGAVMGLPAPINARHGHRPGLLDPARVGRGRRGGRGERQARTAGRGRERRQPRRPCRARLGRRQRADRGRLPQGLLWHRRRSDLRRPPDARGRRHRGRDRPHGARRGRARVPLRQPRLPRDARLRPRGRQRAQHEPPRGDLDPAAARALRSRATLRRGG